MRFQYLIPAGLAIASSAFAHQQSGQIAARHGSLIDIDNDVTAVILNKEENVINNIVGIVKPGRMVKHRRDLAIGVCSIAACAQVNVLVSEAVTALEPVLADIENTVADIAGKTEEELANILFASFSTVESTLATLVGTIGGIAPGGLLPLNKREVLSNADVANTLAALLQGVANAVNLVENSTAGLPIVGGILAPIYAKINGDLGNILSLVGNLLVGVVGLVKNLLSGVLGPIIGLPILGQLLNGLLGGLLGGIL